MGPRCWVCCEGISEDYGELKWEIWGKTYKLVMCRSCGSVFTNPLPDNATLQTLYDNNFDYRWYEDHYAAKLRDCKMRIDEYRGILGHRILDFGGGIGYFSAAARELGFDSSTYDRFLTNKTEIDGMWDTVVALHVLEHSNNLDSIIEQIKGHLIPGGKLILAVPNFSSLGYKKLGVKWVWAQPPLLHLFHFNASGLKSLLSRHGFGEFNISYRERWDANLYSDLENVFLSNIMDALWSKQPCNTFSFYRKLIATINTIRRFRGLKKALRNYNPEDDKYAELQIIASFRG